MSVIASPQPEQLKCLWSIAEKPHRHPYLPHLEDVNISSADMIAIRVESHTINVHGREDNAVQRSHSGEQ